MEADKITLEPTEDGKRWRVRPEGGDVEGHIMAFFSIEPAGVDEKGEPLYVVKSDGEDVTGHIII